MSTNEGVIKRKHHVLFIFLASMISLVSLVGCSGGGGGATSDTVPAAFSFAAQTGAALSTPTTSNSITVGGINEAAAISISGADGMYSLNDGAFTNAAGTVNNGDKITVRVTSSSNHNTAVSAVLSIGGINGSFNVTTGPEDVVADTIPDDFNFAVKTGVALSTVATSDPITVSGINDSAVISITGADGTYSVNGGAYTSAAGTVEKDDIITVRLTSSSANNEAVSTTLHIGGVTGTFSVTTETGGAATDTMPDGFTFTAQTGAAISTITTSAPITVNGINAAASISISGGAYSINGGSYTSTTGTVNNGNTVTVRLTSSSSYATAVSATLTIGGINGAFNVTTGPYVPPVDTTPDAFTITAQTGVARSTVVTSSPITVSGINAATAISITGAGGTYSINGGSYTSVEGTVINGDKISIRVTSSSEYNSAVSTTLFIGSITGSFNVTSEVFIGPDVIHVPADYPTISAAIEAAESGDSIQVAAGIYKERIVIDKSLTLNGQGFEICEINGSETPAEDTCNKPVVTIQSPDVTISGFTITGGYPGIDVLGENSVITLNRVIHNTSGIYCPPILNAIGDAMNGKGIRVKANSCHIINNVIVRNGETYDGEGCGIQAESVEGLSIKNNTISDNSGANGASCGDGFGVLAFDSQGEIINNIISNNDAYDGPNCGVRGHGLYISNSDFNIDYNDIFDNDNIGEASTYGNYDPDDIVIINYSGIEPGEHDISVNPLFVDGFYYTLQALSPCIDAGDPNSAYSNEPAPNGGRINIGAYGNTSKAANSPIN